MPALATYEQAVSPENVAKVSLTGLSFPEFVDAADDAARGDLGGNERRK